MTVDLLKFLIDQFVRLLIGLSWPLLIGLIFVAITCCFRPQVREVIASLARRRITITPKSLEVSAPDQPPGESTPPSLTEATPSLMPLPADALRAGGLPISAYFAPPLRDFVYSVEQIVDASLSAYMTQVGRNREETLKLATVDYLAALHLERASRFIFQSQVDALRFLITANQLTREQIRFFYDAAVNQSPQQYASYTFESWLGFLASWGLIQVDEEKVLLTSAGRAIVHYMEVRGYLTRSLPF